MFSVNRQSQKLGLLGVFFALMLGSISSPSSVKADISCDDLNQLFQSKYAGDFHVDWTVGPFQCPSTMYSIASAMYELDHTTFVHSDDPAHTAPDFYQWTTSIFTRTSYVASNDALPYAAAYSGGGILTLMDLYAAQGVEWRTGVLVHEARHNQSDDPAHVDCAHGNMMGKGQACDASFFGGDFPNAGSGYNYDFSYYWWVSAASDQTDLSKEVAQSFTRDYIVNRFNTVDNQDVQKFAP